MLSIEKIKKGIAIITLVGLSAMMIGCGLLSNDTTESMEVIEQQTVSEDNAQKQTQTEGGESNNSEIITKDYGEMQNDFYFIVVDVFSIVKEDGSSKVVAAGYSVNSPLCLGAQVEVLTSAEKISTTVIGLETKEGFVNAVEEYENVGVLLDIEGPAKMSAGDIIVFPNQGNEQSTVDCVVSLLERGDSGFYSFSIGESIYVNLNVNPEMAMLSSSTFVEDGVYKVTLELCNSQYCIDNQIIRLYDTNMQEIAIGRIVH